MNEIELLCKIEVLIKKIIKGKVIFSERFFLKNCFFFKQKAEHLAIPGMELQEKQEN